MKRTFRFLLPLLMAGGLTARGATQYWDTAASAGFQGGNGTWSEINPLWSSTTAGTSPGGWINGSDAFFPTNGEGASVITLTNAYNIGSLTFAGTRYTLVVTNGGRLLNGTNTSIIGQGSSNNAVILAGRAGAPVLWEVGAPSAKMNLYLGTGNNAGWTNNTLVIDGGGAPGGAVVTNVSNLWLAYSSSASFPMNGGHSVSILNGGRLFSVGGAIGYMRFTTGNRILLSDPGSLWDLGGGLLNVGTPNANGACTFNSLVIANGAVATNAGLVQVNLGMNGAATYGTPMFNQLIITNNGRLYGNAASSGGGSSNLIALYGGAGVTSLWSGAGNLVIGANGNFNRMLIDGQGATGSASVIQASLSVSANAYACSNSLWVGNGGQLTLTNQLASGIGTNSTILIDGGSQVSLSVNVNAFNLTSPQGWLDIAGTGTLVNCSGKMLYSANTPDVTVTFRDGAVVTNVEPGLGLAGGGNRCRLDILNGAKAYLSAVSSPAYLSSYGHSMTTTVSGAGSLMDVRGIRLSIGSYSGGTNNTLLIANGGTVTNIALSLSYDSSLNNMRNIRNNAVIVTNGGRLFGSGVAYIGYGNGWYNSRLQVSDAGSLFDNGLQPVNVGNVTNTFYSVLQVDGGAVATNVGALAMNGQGGLVLVSNAGALHAAGDATIGGTGISQSNTSLVTGAGSLWNLNGKNLTVGANGGLSGNTVVIDQGGAVDNVGTLVIISNNSVTLRGGMLGLAAATVTNGLFTVGDGSQTALLKGLGSLLTFNTGLLVTNAGSFSAAGAVSAGAAGVTFASGSTLSPGLNGAGPLTVNGELKLQTGSSCRLNVTNLALGPGLGWDLVSASTLSLGGSLTIRMDSMGAPAANFDSGRDYNLRILNYGSQTGYDPANIAVDTTDFANGGSWTVTNAANALWLVYRGAPAPSAATYTWKVPNSGNWSDTNNWMGGAAPAAGGDDGWILEFGDNGTKYYSTNNLAGPFRLNQLRFISTTSNTNVLSGGQLALTNAGAKVDYAAGATGGFIISNYVRLASDAEFGGNALGGTLRLSGIVTNLATCTKRGTWTLALANNANVFSGPVVVDSPDGALRLDAANTLNGPGSVTVSNGLLVAFGSHTFSAGVHNRRALITGSGSVWSNATANNTFTLGSGSTNIQFVVNKGGRLFCEGFYPFKTSRDCLLLITNEGSVWSGGNASSLGEVSTNCQLIVTGTNSWIYFNQNFGASLGGTSNLVVSERGGLVRGGNNFYLYAGSFSNRYVIRDGGQAQPYGLKVFGTNNTGWIGGAGTYVLASPSSGYYTTVGNNADNGNTLTIADQAVVTQSVLSLAQNGAWSNTLVITNGGRLFAHASYESVIAWGPSNAYDNRLMVTGTGTLWNAGAKTLTICSGTGMLNRLVVETGGLVTNISNLVLANGAGASNNSVVVDGGRLQALSLFWSNSLPNSLILTRGGMVALTSLVATNANQTVAFNGGTLQVRSAWVSNGIPFTVGDGTQAAVLALSPGTATNLFADGLVITNNAELTGNGLVQATTTVFGAVSPGAAVGILTNSGDVVLRGGSATRIELASAAGPGTGWDLLAVTNGALTLAGSLSVTLTADFMPTNTQSYVIMTNLGPLGVTGMFDNLAGATVPAYSNGLARAIGFFQVSIGTQGVALDGFQPFKLAPGTLLYIR